MPVELILALIRLLCPYLKAMAEKSDSPVDDYVVAIICSMVTTGQPVKKE